MGDAGAEQDKPGKNDSVFIVGRFPDEKAGTRDGTARVPNLKTTVSKRLPCRIGGLLTELANRHTAKFP
jgi:hypothetical protein